MSLLPNSPKDAPITWLENRIDAWTSNAAQIGLSPEQTSALGLLIQAARGSYNSALQSRQAARTATQTQNEAIADMRGLATALIATIKAFADATDDENVYALAEFDPPSPPTPSADPVPPTDITLGLRPQGVIDISWKGTVAQGTTYAVQRSLDNGQNWATIGSVPARTLSDGGVPAGTAQVAYRLRAIKPAAGPGASNQGPRYSAYTASQTIYLGVPGNQSIAGTIAPQGALGEAG